MPLESVQGSRVLKICLRGLDLEDERGMVRRDPPGSRSGVYSRIRGTCVLKNELQVVFPPHRDHFCHFKFVTRWFSAVDAGILLECLSKNAGWMNKN